MPTRVEQCPNHGPCILFRCTRGSHKLLGRHEHAAIQAPKDTALDPSVRSVLRSVAAVAHVALASSLSAMIHLASAGLLKRGTAKARSGVPPGHGLDVEILPRWGDTTPGPTGTPAHWPSTRHTQPAGNQ